MQNQFMIGLNFKLRIKNKDKCRTSHCGWPELQIAPYTK
jgi:hypothetical protein